MAQRGSTFGARLKIAAAGALAVLKLAAPGGAQAADVTTISVDPVQLGAYGGQVPFTGVAADCTSTSIASSVSIYDETAATGVPLATATLGAPRAVPVGCGTNAGSTEPIGFTATVPTTSLTNGTHQLSFVAQFPDGSVATTTVAVPVQNAASLTANTAATTPTYLGTASYLGTPST